MSDLFPRLEEKHVDHGVLETQIRAAIARMGLEEVNGMPNTYMFRFVTVYSSLYSLFEIIKNFIFRFTKPN